MSAQSAVVARLRQETSDIHHALHGCRVSRELLAGSLQPAQLLRLLEGLLPLHLDLEAHLDGRCVLDPDWWRFSPAIAHDLALLGAAAQEAPVVLPLFASAASDSTVLGITYVLAGSRLGASRLRGAVERCFPERGTELRFCDGPTDAGRQWPEVLEMLQRGCDAPEEAAAAARLVMSAMLDIYRSVE